MNRLRGINTGRLFKALVAATCAVGLIGTGWLVGQRNSADEIDRLIGEIDAVMNEQVASCLAAPTNGATTNTTSEVAVYDFGSLVCNTPEQAEILMSSTSLQKRIVGRICSESL